MSEQTRFKRRGMLAAAAGAMAAIMVRPASQTAQAASGTGDQGPLILGSNDRYKAVNGNTSNVANVSSVATVIRASPNFGNFLNVAPDHVFSGDARPADGDIDGLVGFAAGTGSGVRGVGASGVSFGVRGEGGYAGVIGTGPIGGVFGFSEMGLGVAGQSVDSYGGSFEGGKAPLRLVPGATSGRPSGTHLRGELYVDGAGSLFFCTADGTPGTWIELSWTTSTAPAAVVSSFRTLPTPERFVDTRSGLGGVQGPVPPGSTRTFQMTGRDGQAANANLRVPDNATSLVGNLTVISGSGVPVGSYVTLWPAGAVPTVSNINFGPNSVVANSFTVGLSTPAGNGFINVFNLNQCDYILDVTGYFD